jgi:hypothetical protein
VYVAYPESIVAVVAPDSSDKNMKMGTCDIKHGKSDVSVPFISYLPGDTLPKQVVKSAINMFLLKQQMACEGELESFQPIQSEYEDEME